VANLRARGSFTADHVEHIHDLDEQGYTRMHRDCCAT
jgi:hypothetical protein